MRPGVVYAHARLECHQGRIIHRLDSASAADMKRQLAVVRMLFDWLIIDQIRSGDCAFRNI